MKKYLVKGRNTEELLEKVAEHFKVKVEDVEYEVIKEEKGIIGVKEVALRVWLKEKVSIVNSLDEDDTDFKKQFMEIKIQKSGIYLCVKHGFREAGLNENEIMSEIDRREIRKAMTQEIFRAISERNGEFVKIAEYDPEYYIDSEIKISFQDGKIAASVEVTAPKRGNGASFEKIMAKIKEHGIVFGLKEENIKKIINDNIYDEPVLIAEGKHEVNGEDAQIIFMFDTEKSNEFAETEDGSVNYKELDLIENVIEGQVIARKIPFTEGEPGMNVFGEVIDPKPGKDRKFPKGKNTHISEDGEFLIATISGHVFFAGNLATVNPVFDVKKDVDYSTGNLTFIGTIVIHGNIRDGFSVKAGGDIVVEGRVDDAVLDAGGNVIIKGSVIGREDGIGSIQADGSFEAKFAENMRIKAKNGVTIGEHILNCSVETDGVVKTLGDKSKIMGGSIIAAKEIITHTIGSDYGSPTVLEVGVSPEYRDRLKYLDDELKKMKIQKEGIEADLGTFKRLQEEKKLDEKKRSQMIDLTRQQFILLKNINNMQLEKNKIDSIILDSKKGKIHASDKIYNGVSIKIGDAKLITKDTFKYVTFYYDENRKEIGILPCEVT